VEVRAAKELVEAVEERSGQGEQLRVVSSHQGGSADEDVEAGRLGSVVALVAAVGFMDDTADVSQRRLVEVVAAEEALVAAAAVTVAEIDTAHVERRRILRNLSGSSTKTNCGAGSMNLWISQALAARST
jgi:UDP-N-acetylmuramyl pentapeptide phosphotransferase/UDP-N-acetylglucosamine-1-phosphate transferase